MKLRTNRLNYNKGHIHTLKSRPTSLCLFFFANHLLNDVALLCAVIILCLLSRFTES